ncbi:unnamed protein product [Hydatigera taeniaeformis]|uniref:ANK_REP_REGION domain-containing protein n=1 Tax=Hydatigena taeniaeformis TaxID=6205 RepID=A0A0R3XDE1_HYDTA|nr:unnamed protein product [Hydatigera taeniaeformis]
MRHRTPIIEARSQGHHDVVQYLLRAEHTDAASKVDESGHTRVPATTTTTTATATASLMARNAQPFNPVCTTRYCYKCVPLRPLPHLC